MLREVYRDHVPGLSRSSLVNQEPRKPAPFRLGVSRCLLGDEVRYDGGHKRDRFLVDVLGRYVEWVPVCPEVEAGMGTPREAIHLIRGAPSTAGPHGHQRTGRHEDDGAVFGAKGTGTGRPELVRIFNSRLAPAERLELEGTIADYRKGLVPLVVPLALVKRYVSTLDIGHIRNQVYLSPHPMELMLRNCMVM